MLLQATRTIGDGIRALHELGRRAIARLQRIPLAATLTFAVALAWLVAAGWWNYVRPQDFDAKAYERYQEEVAKCRELKTSEARYDCVVQSMIHRDQVNFGTAMFVFLPPIFLIFGHYLWREIRTNMREREHARRAEQRSRRQLSKLRQDMMEERAAAKAAQALVKSAEAEHGFDHGHRAHGMPHPSTPHPAVPASADPPTRAPKRA